MIRRAFYQVLRAFALIMLLLFEMGVGLFIEAKDIPAAVWVIIGGFGVVYVILICAAESMQTSWVEDYVIDDDCMQSE